MLPLNAGSVVLLLCLVAIGLLTTESCRIWLAVQRGGFVVKWPLLQRKNKLYFQEMGKSII